MTKYILQLKTFGVNLILLTSLMPVVYMFCRMTEIFWKSCFKLQNNYQSECCATQYDSAQQDTNDLLNVSEKRYGIQTGCEVEHQRRDDDCEQHLVPSGFIQCYGLASCVDCQYVRHNFYFNHGP